MNIADAKAGMRVYARIDFYEGADDYSPAGYLGYRGDMLIIKEVRPQYQCMSVYHPKVTDGTSFTVYPSEVMTETPLITEIEKREYIKRFNKERGGL